MNSSFLWFIIFLLSYNWHITLLSLMHIMYRFDALIHYKIITIVALTNISIRSHNYHFLYIYSHSNFQVYNNTVFLTKITMLYIRFPRTYWSYNWYPLADVSISATSLPHVTSFLFLWVCLFQIHIQVIFYSICLALTYHLP